MTRRLPLLLLFTATAVADVENLSNYAKGLFAERAGDSNTARLHFEATLENDPDSFTVAERTARTQLRTEDLAAASKTLRSYAGRHPDHLESQIHYSDFLRRQAPEDAMAQKVALETLESANTRFPHTPGIFTRLITIHEEAENRDASLALFQAEFTHQDQEAHVWVSLIPLARTLIPGDDPSFRPTLDELHARAHRDGIADAAIARRVSDYYRQQGEGEKAIAALAEHITHRPDSLELRTRMGLLLLSAGREEEGVKALEDTIAIDPDHIYAHRSLAQYYERSGHTERALHHHAEVLRAAGGDPLEFLELANRYLDHGQPHPARLLLEKARFEHPDHAAIVARLAIATLRDGETTAAANLFRQAESLARDSKDPEMARFLDADFQIDFSRALRDAGDLPAAESRLREAIRNVPDDQPGKAAHALRELARLWLDQNKNRTPAVSLLRRAESLDPGNSETAALLERAKGGD